MYKKDVVVLQALLYLRYTIYQYVLRQAIEIKGNDVIFFLPGITRGILASHKILLWTSIIGKLSFSMLIVSFGLLYARRVIYILSSKLSCQIMHMLVK